MFIHGDLNEIFSVVFVIFLVLELIILKWVLGENESFRFKHLFFLLLNTLFILYCRWILLNYHGKKIPEIMIRFLRLCYCLFICKYISTVFSRHRHIFLHFMFVDFFFKMDCFVKEDHVSKHTLFVVLIIFFRYFSNKMYKKIQ